MPNAECTSCSSVLQAALDSMHASSNSDSHQLELGFEEQQVLLRGCQLTLHLCLPHTFAYRIVSSQKTCMHVLPDQVGRTIPNGLNVQL